jgi:anthranilate phosphoribosyltransferase
VFNILGPLTNPAGADGQVLGVPHARLVPVMAEALGELGSRHVFVVSGSDGLDELTLDGPTHVAEYLNGAVSNYEITPEDAGLSRAGRDAIQGDDSATNAAILRGVLEGKPGPHRDIVVFNAAAGILAASDSSDWRAGVEAAQKAIDSGAALDKLEQLIKVSHDSG